MRRFTDGMARQWDVQIGRESYGMHVLLFTPVDGSDVYQTMLGVDTWLEAEQTLESLSDEVLCDHLDRAQPWGAPGGPGF